MNWNHSLMREWMFVIMLCELGGGCSKKGITNMIFLLVSGLRFESNNLRAYSSPVEWSFQSIDFGFSGVVKLSLWTIGSSEHSSCKLLCILNFRFIVEFQWFLMALSVLPGNHLAIKAHLFPTLLTHTFTFCAPRWSPRLTIQSNATFLYQG